MRYHAPTKCFTVTHQDLDLAVTQLLWAIRCIREQAQLPLESHRREGKMEPPQFAEQGILDAAKTLGIDLGAARFGQLDVRGEA